MEEAEGGGKEREEGGRGEGERHTLNRRRGGHALPSSSTEKGLGYTGASVPKASLVGLSLSQKKTK